jgi:hypothetical protein
LVFWLWKVVGDEKLLHCERSAKIISDGFSKVTLLLSHFLSKNRKVP